MQYSYNPRSLPALAPTLLRSLDEAAQRLGRKIEALDLHKLPISPYGRENVEEFRGKAEATIKKYLHLMAWALFPELPGGRETFVDYGGGHGFFACLAREAGFGRVVYNDIFDGCCGDARILARQLGCEADEYICGDIHTVQESFRLKPTQSCVLSSINVIEHIYDIEDFIRAASSVSEGAMTLVLSTSANPLNPIVRRRHYRQHLEWEFKDGPHESSYPMDTLKAFHTVRCEIIRQYGPHLFADEVEDLASATRGMRKDDIERCVREFDESGVVQVEPDHPTNTCDPLTGSWQERLLDIDAVKRFLESAGFSVGILGGYYNDIASNTGLLKRITARMLNLGISLLGSHGARLSPCFTFHAVRR